MKSIILLAAYIVVASSSALAIPNHDRPEFKRLGAHPQPQKPVTPAPTTPGAPTTGK